MFVFAGTLPLHNVFCSTAPLQLRFQSDFDQPMISESSTKRLWMIDFAQIVVRSSKPGQGSGSVRTVIALMHTLDAFQPQGAQEAI